MEWFKTITELIGSIAWPVIALLCIWIFRKELKSKLSTVKSVKYPGGAVEMAVEQLESRIEKSNSFLKETPTTHSLFPSLFISAGNLQLSVAQVRVDIEREVFLLSRVVLKQSQLHVWKIMDRIEELVSQKVLERDFMANVKAFLSISDTILTDASIPSGLKERSLFLGSSLLVQIHQKRRIEEMIFAFEDIRLWRGYSLEGEISMKYHSWAAVTATCPDFDYDYDVYRAAAVESNKRMAQRFGSEWLDSHSMYILSLEDFVSVLEFREKQLLKLIDAWDSVNLEPFEKANRWSWPDQWGHIHWVGPIIRENLSKWAAEGELYQTRDALNRYRRRLQLIEANERMEPSS